MNGVIKRLIASATKPSEPFKPSLTYTVITTLGLLSAIWAVTGVMTIRAYRVYELENYGAIAITPARVLHHYTYRMSRFADYVFTDPASGASVFGKGTIEMRELTDLDIGKSTTIDVAFLRKNPDVNAPNSYLLDDPSNDQALPVVFGVSVVLVSVGLLRSLWKAIRLQRHAVTDASGP